MTNLLTKQLSPNANSFVEAVGNALDKSVTSDEERKALENEMAKASLQYEIEMASLGLKETQAYLADVDSARQTQSRVQESENASWLAKNVHSILALGIVGLTFVMYAWMISVDATKFTDNGMKDVLIYILGALTTVSTQVASYFFGSSQGSAEKSKTLASLTK